MDIIVKLELLVLFVFYIVISFTALIFVYNSTVKNSPNMEEKRMDKVKQHNEICKELNSIYEAKNKDYGDSFGKGFKLYGMPMPLIRLDDKLNRLKSLTNSKEQCVKNESIEDTLLGLANYAIMTVIELRKKEESKMDDKEWVFPLDVLAKCSITKGMDIKEYQEKSVRTMDNNLKHNDKVVNMIVGLNGEIGEVTDIFKKHLFHGHDLDMDHLKEELGDVMFYIVNLATIFNIDMSEVLKMNVDKLLKRYPNGFNSQDSINREG
jgi:NTP pyrophosphatase (non-canonical NTP hydrolase)